MINWNLLNSDENPEGWYFSDFEIQEYLLSVIYVGGEFFNEYGATKFDVEDCKRLRNAILFHKDLLNVTPKQKIRYETINKGLAELDKIELLATLEALDRAAEQAIKKNVSLIFYGD